MEPIKQNFHLYTYAPYAVSPIYKIEYCRPTYCWGGGNWFGEEDIKKQLRVVHGCEFDVIPQWFPMRNKEGMPYNRWCYVFDKSRRIGEWVGESVENSSNSNMTYSPYSLNPYSLTFTDFQNYCGVVPSRVWPNSSTPKIPSYEDQLTCTEHRTHLCAVCASNDCWYNYICMKFKGHIRFI